MTQIEGSSASAEPRDLVAKALEAMGGLQELRSINALLIVAAGHRFESEQERS